MCDNTGFIHETDVYLQLWSDDTARVYINCPAASVCIITGFYILPCNTEVYIYIAV